MLIRVHLLGDLAPYELTQKIDVNSTREAIRALESQSEGFRSYMISQALLGAEYQVLVGDRDIDETELSNPVGKQDIYIIPVLSGSGNIGKIILGVALIGLGLTGVGFLGLSATSMLLLGGTLALSGIVGLFAKPEPKPEEEKNSFVFNGATNTSNVNGRVNIVFGAGYKGEGIVVGSMVVSAAVRSYEVNNDDDD